MEIYVQLCGLLLYALFSTATGQSEERLWHSTTPPTPLADAITAKVDVVDSTTSVPLLLDEIAVAPLIVEIQEKSDEATDKDGKDDKVETPIEFKTLEADLDKILENATEPQSKPRKWMSLPEIPEEEETSASSEEVTENSSDEATSETPAVEVDEYSLNDSDMGLPQNISEMLEAAEEGFPVIQETIISKKTTVYVTITESLGDTEPTFVNLTGIRDFTGMERRLVGGCLDLSDLLINGEDAKEIIQRMAKHNFHRLDLSNNNITELPLNTFSPVAFTVRELRLDGNPLMSNDGREGSMLHRGGLFHLTELRELNLSNCELRDIDFFTPWNSNRLEVVDLSANRLSQAPANLQFFHKLRKLYLEGNPITTVGELPFALLWNLQVLSLSACQVASITSDPFRNMEHLKQLSLEGNNLTHIGEVRLPRGSSGVKLYLSDNPWHCACDMLGFIERHNYGIRDLESIRCSTPRWLEGLRTAYLTKELLSLDSVDGDCAPLEVRGPPAPAVSRHYPVVRTDRLETASLAIFALAAILMLVHILWTRRREKYRLDDDRSDINYIRVDRKSSFK